MIHECIKLNSLLNVLSEFLIDLDCTHKVKLVRNQLQKFVDIEMTELWKGFNEETIKLHYKFVETYIDCLNNELQGSDIEKLFCVNKEIMLLLIDLADKNIRFKTNIHILIAKMNTIIMKDVNEDTFQNNMNIIHNLVLWE